MTRTAELPLRLAELVDDFAAVGSSDKLEMLLELSRDLPELPDELAGQRDSMEQVHECQTPLFMVVRAEDSDSVRLFFDAPAESPTTRGFASIMATGLDGESAEAVLGVPDDFYVDLGLAEAVSPLRLRGMAAMLARIKRNVREQQAA